MRTSSSGEESYQPYESATINTLISTLPSIDSQRQYPLRLKPFFDFADISGSSIGEKADHFVRKAKENPQWAHDILVNYVNHCKQRVNIKNDLAAGTLHTVFRSIKLFYENNDLETTGTTTAPINWRRLSKGLPKARTKANDRAYTVEEIHKLVEHSDRRMKAIVYTMCSSGIRAGAWTYLRWKHVKPIIDDKTGGIIAAKLIVYADQPEQYYTFITPEAYNTLKDYIDYRISAGENITNDSWLVRDSCKTTDVKYGAKASLATNPKPLKAETVEKLLGRALRIQNVRNPLTKEMRRHEYKAAHGLRKFFDNAADSAGMKYLHIEYLMGHDIGITRNYRRFQEQKLLNDYLKAIPFLTISSQKTTQLQQQVAELTVRNEEQKYVIERKLAEKEKEAEQAKQELVEMKISTSNLLLFNLLNC
jgi:hypothetical protein